MVAIFAVGPAFRLHLLLLRAAEVHRVAGLDVPTAYFMDVIVAAAAVALQARGLLCICPIFHICVASLCDRKYTFGFVDAAAPAALEAPGPSQ